MKHAQYLTEKDTQVKRQSSTISLVYLLTIELTLFFSKSFCDSRYRQPHIETTKVISHLLKNKAQDQTKKADKDLSLNYKIITH